MTFKTSTAARNAMGDALADLVDGGAFNGYFEFRTGAPPGPNAADSGTLLATCDAGDPAFGDAAAAVVTANAISDDVDVDDTGTVGHFRLKDSDGNVIGEGTVTASGGGGDIEVDSVSFVAGGTVSITGFSITIPES